MVGFRILFFCRIVRPPLLHWERMVFYLVITKGRLKTSIKMFSDGLDFVLSYCANHAGRENCPTGLD
ncbi:hypothetical protein BWD09_09155 [Neisseria dentiae]|uniref:Uncharacterized protein n=1 Tax=Neisseria dentiae TaxID=194197 RepID=A0A1X3D661_9NEIS|nr:hypothetical protein [Neisseria dentiae]OSI15211.1 hypothetical protein BWD09_09155 [Neisseria dentiae]QMT45777.1 hypothetical protein H3L92_02910 [Neisseria dentiae]